MTRPKIDKHARKKIGPYLFVEHHSSTKNEMRWALYGGGIASDLEMHQIECKLKTKRMMKKLDQEFGAKI